MTDRNNLEIYVGDHIYVPKPVVVVDGYPVEDQWEAVVDSIDEDCHGREYLIASVPDSKKQFKIYQEDVDVDAKNICLVLTPERFPEFFHVH